VIASSRIRFLVVLLALAPVGCSFSYSSESSAKTLASPFTSSGSSASSSNGGAKQSYRDDVRDYTAAYVGSRADLTGFERGLADVARRHGVTNWEEDDTTYVGVGAGLAKAKVSVVVVEVYKQHLSQGDPAKAAAIQRGYDAGH
jgi:hypothetical protein